MSRLHNWKQTIGYQSGLLALFALLASALLGMADYSTRDVINLRLEEDLQASLAEVVPTSLYDNNLLQDRIIINSGQDRIGNEETLVYLARNDDQVEAVSFRLTAPDGYSGAIHLIMGVDKNGSILGVRVISHAETPGLGDKIEVTKSKWILNFQGRSLQNLSVAQWAVKKDGGEFDQFSGATITPRAIVKSVYLGLQFFNNHKAELLAS